MAVVIEHPAIVRSDAAVPLYRAEAMSATFSTSFTSILAFVAVVTEGSFAKAGAKLGVGRSAISRNIQKLEAQLSTILIIRSTRTMKLTPEGRQFFDRCHHGIAQMAEAVNELLEQRQGPPSGPLRIAAPVCFGRKIVGPMLEGFSKIYPDMCINLLLDDRPIDFAVTEADVSFQSGRIADSRVIARRLGPMRRAICASRSYVAKHGLPKTIEELSRHDCIGHGVLNGRASEWEFHSGRHIKKYLPPSRITLSNSDLVLHAVLQGWGIAQMADFQIADHLKANELMVTLSDSFPNELGHYLCYPSRQYLPGRTRAFVDFVMNEFPTLHRIEI